jgi:hypothetical protein
MVKVGQLQKKGQPKKQNSLKDKFFDFIFGKLPYRVSQFLRNNGHKRVESITIYRAPIQRMIDKLFNILSFGKFEEAKNKLGYDDLFHLYMIIQLSDDTKLILEKNQDINISDDIDTRDTAESLKIEMKTQPTLFELLENTRKLVGDEKFYKYDSFRNNCQDFLYNVLKSNNLLNETNSRFIKQNAGELLKSLPAYASTMANVATQTGSYINRFLQFIGLRGFFEGGLIE